MTVYPHWMWVATEMLFWCGIAASVLAILAGLLLLTPWAQSFIDVKPEAKKSECPNCRSSVRAIRLEVKIGMDLWKSELHHCFYAEYAACADVWHDHT